MAVYFAGIKGTASVGTKSWIDDVGDWFSDTWDDIWGTAEDTVESVEVPAATAGCGFEPGNVCPGGPTPQHSPTGVHSVPYYINESELIGGKLVTYEPWALNCDGSTEGIQYVCHFRYIVDGERREEEDITASPYDSDGHTRIQTTLYTNRRLDGAPSCDIHYINPNDPEDHPEPLPNIVPLYGPDIISETEPYDVCADYPEPRIEPGFQIGYEPSVIYVGDPVRFSFSGNSITDCHGNLHPDYLQVFFVINGRDSLAIFDGVNYTADTFFPEPTRGDAPYRIGLKVVDTLQSTEKSWDHDIAVYVSDRPGTVTDCDTNPRPQVGSLSVNPSSLNPLGQIIYGTPVTFDLPGVTDCDGEPSDLSITLHAGTSEAPMTNSDGLYSATVNAEYWGPPIYAEIHDTERDTVNTSYLWSLPPIVPPDVSSCEADPRPEAYTVRGPNPGVDYDVSSGIPIQWQIWAKNCDGTRDGLSATCDFGPLGPSPIFSGDRSGVITVEMAFPERLTGFFLCDITGSNGEVLSDGATLYPPYYLSPIIAPTVCEESSNRPQVGALSINPSSLNVLGQIVLGTPVTFDLPNTADCDGEPSSLSVTLYAGTTPATMINSGGIYSATVTAAYWGTPIRAVVDDLARSTSSTSFLWSLPPIVSPSVSACTADPLPEAFTVVGPNPLRDYNISSGIPVVWQIYAEDCDGTRDSLSATCDFGPLGTTTGTGDFSGIITISRSLTIRLGGSFPCDITGSYGTHDNGAILYPPWYSTP